MATHKVVLEAYFFMEEMDGSPADSAETVLNIVTDLIHNHYDATAVINVVDYADWSKYNEEEEGAGIRAEE